MNLDIKYLHCQIDTEDYIWGIYDPGTDPGAMSLMIYVNNI